MDHKKYKELLELMILDELNETEKIDLENHFLECKECLEEYNQLIKMNYLIKSEKPSFPNNFELQNARNRLFIEIEKLQEPQSLIKKLKNFYADVFSQKYTLAFGSVALVLVGLTIGYLLFNRESAPKNYFAENEIDLDKIEKGELKITDVSLPKSFSNTDEYVFKLGENDPKIYKGNLNDETIQKLLAITFSETENPGYKIKTANTLIDFMPKNFKPDKKIKEVFINTVKFDNNPGVRKSALQALINFQFDDEIRDALLYTLQNDDNASNRMDAINVLLTMNVNKDSIDHKVKCELEQKISNEENSIVKLRTTKFLLGEK